MAEFALIVAACGLVAIGFGLALRAFLQELARARTVLFACEAFCPGCKRDLTKGCAECVDIPGQMVCYACECGTSSRWDFDLPVPVFIDSEGWDDE